MAGVEDAFDASVLRRLVDVAMLPDGLVSEFVHRDDQYLLSPAERLRQACRVCKVTVAHPNVELLEIYSLLRISNAYPDLSTWKLLEKTLHDLPA